MRRTIAILSFTLLPLACSSSSPAGSPPSANTEGNGSVPDPSLPDSSTTDAALSADSGAVGEEPDASVDLDASFSCSSPLDDAGFSSLSNFPLSTWCAQAEGSLSQFECGSWTMIDALLGVDCSATFLFDTASGALVASITGCNASGVCTASTPGFAFPAACLSPPPPAQNPCAGGDL